MQISWQLPSEHSCVETFSAASTCDTYFCLGMAGWTICSDSPVGLKSRLQALARSCASNRTYLGQPSVVQVLPWLLPSPFSAKVRRNICYVKQCFVALGNVFSKVQLQVLMSENGTMQPLRGRWPDQRRHKVERKERTIRPSSPCDCLANTASKPSQVQQHHEGVLPRLWMLTL